MEPPESTDTGTDTVSGGRVWRCAELTASPWRNGGGWTREVVPARTRTGDRRGWRLSIATIAASGPFSAFPGLERTLLLADDAPLSLSVDGRAHDLRRGDVLRFPGEAAAHARVGPHPVRAVNLMTERNAHRGDVEVRPLRGGCVLPGAVALVVLRGSLRAGGAPPLGELDGVLGGAAGIAVEAADALVAVVRVTTSPSPSAEHGQVDTVV